jgi:hypothetical protein
VTCTSIGSKFGEGEMKNMLKIIGKLSIAFLFATALTHGVLAQSSERTNAKNNEQYARNIEGSWDHLTSRLNCQTGAVLGTFQAMFTFSDGGTFWEAGTNVAPSLRSVSHGVWERDSPGAYTTAFQFFRFNPDGTLAGRQIVRQHIEVSDDGESYTATAIAKVIDAAGNVIATNCASGVGTRFD